MPITSRDTRYNVILTPGERGILRVAFLDLKALVASKRIKITNQLLQIIAHTWDLLRDAAEPPERFYVQSGDVRRGVDRGAPLTVVRDAAGATIVTDKDRTCLRACFAAGLSMLSQQRIAVPESMQGNLARAWDVVRNLDDPALPPFKSAAEARIQLPFSGLLKPVADRARGVRGNF